MSLGIVSNDAILAAVRICDDSQLEPSLPKVGGGTLFPVAIQHDLQ